MREAERALVARYAPPWVLVDTRFRITQQGGATNRYLAASRRAGADVRELVREGLAPVLRTALEEARRELRPVRREAIEVRRRRGGVQRVNVEVVPIAAASPGQAEPPPGGGFLLLFDDEPRPRAGQLEHASREPVDVLGGIDVPIILLDGDRRVRQFTPRARAFLDLSPADLGRPLGEAGGEPRGDMLDRLVSEALDSPSPCEREVQDRDGRWHQVQIRPCWTADGARGGVVVSFIEVDAQRRAVADADGALDRAAAMLDAVRVPLLLLDHRLHVRSANRAFHAAFTSQPGVVGSSWFEVEGGAWDVPALRAAVADLLAGRPALPLDVEIEIPRGRRRTVEVSGSALGGQHEPPVLLLTLVDVTERARLLRVATDARASAEQANRTKDVFLATLSHELRAPLHTITLQAELLLIGAAPGPAKVRRIGEAISQAARAQGRIIGDLLDVSAILAGKMQLRLQPVDVPAVVGAAISGIRAAAAARQIRLRIALDRSVGLVLGDPTRLQQVLANLLANAVKFTPAAGQIAVALGKSEAGVRIRVSDTGQGIARELLPHVFDRFVQADSPASSGYAGLGLGLAIVRDLVRLHRGAVRAESAGLGRGATFTVELPTLAARAASAEARRRGPMIAAEPLGPARRRDELKGIRVLIVEDDPSARDALSDILRIRSAEVRAVGSAAEVMDALAEFRPDVMLCDVAMPGEDGYSLMRRVRALGPDRGGAIPAVALTALATGEDRRRALTAGFHMHVAKPTPAAALCDAVRRVYARLHDR